MRVEAFDDIGGFDETLRLGEDVDLVWRLDEAGWVCRYEPTAVVWHEPRASLVARLRQHRGYGSSAAPLALRHPRSLTPFRANIWTAGALLLAAVGRPVAAIGIGLGSAAALPSKLRGVPPVVALRLAVQGHVAAVRQFAVAIRRVWWPIVALAAICSRRARWVAVGAVCLDLASTPTDLAYGLGVWEGVIRHRTMRPLLPDIQRSSTSH